MRGEVSSKTSPHKAADHQDNSQSKTENAALVQSPTSFLSPTSRTGTTTLNQINSNTTLNQINSNQNSNYNSSSRISSTNTNTSNNNGVTNSTKIVGHSDSNSDNNGTFNKKSNNNNNNNNNTPTVTPATVTPGIRQMSPLKVPMTGPLVWPGRCG